MRFGIHYIYWQKDLDASSYIRHLKRAAQSGFDVLELGDDLLLKMQDDDLRELKKVKEDLNMELSLGLDPPPFGELTAISETSRKKGISYYQSVFPKLEYLGINMLGGRFLYTSEHKQCVSGQNGDRERGRESLRVLAKSAANYGITLNVEVCNRYECHIVNTAEQGVKFLKELEEDNVKLLLDTFHMNIEEVSFSNAIITAGKFLGHVHIVENNRRLPGKGHLPWGEIMGALKSIKYDGMLNMEPLVQTGGQLADFCRIWRDMTDAADDEGMDIQAKKSLEFIKYFTI